MDAAIRILTATGDITDAHRQEFILWSDTLRCVDAGRRGWSTRLPAGATESTVLGPFYVPGSPLRAFGESMLVEGSIGTPAWVHGRVLDTSGEPIAGAELDLWQNDADSSTRAEAGGAGGPSARPLPHARGRELSFIAVRPVPYPIPDDGRWGGCSTRPDVIPGGRRTSTPWCERPAFAPS